VAAQLGSAHLSELLTAACELNNTHAVVELLAKAGKGDPYYASLDGVAPAAVQSWLRKALHLGDVRAITALWSANALELVGSEAALRLLWQAVEQRQTAAAAELLTFMALKHSPAQHQKQQQQQQQQMSSAEEDQRQQQGDNWLDAASVSALLKAAMEQHCSSVADVCRIKAVKELLPADEVLSLLQHAVSNAASRAAISSLCSLPAARELQPNQAVDLLLQALQCDNSEAVRLMIRELPAASNLTAAGNAGQLLQLTADRGWLPRSFRSGQWLQLLKGQLRRLQRPIIEQVLQETLAASGYRSPAF
jgi:hypothetical protein